MPYLPVAPDAIVERGYIQSPTAKNAASSVYVAMALFHSPKPSFVEVSLQSGRSGVCTSKSRNQWDSTAIPSPAPLAVVPLTNTIGAEHLLALHDRPVAD